MLQKAWDNMVQPEQPGEQFAKLALRAPKEFSGKVMKWDDKPVLNLNDDMISNNDSINGSTPMLICLRLEKSCTQCYSTRQTIMGMSCSWKIWNQCL